ncbi:MAG: pyridoxamine 5'-phosphate oxidase family protein [Parvimonas sp.]|uniref:pyridoxamine 5'-phosphate oxidase family protein n=1 Tax=Parvimonas sp. TaxID=1944660 RepID=UPI001CB58CBE|nr:pyridoxamine 5'-phosphate oxidase family protein [Parvimonas sp.]MBF1294613.1 pyridoxamine 5'-phosphate oxidase family protein [Parvimonas sp.]
MEMRRKDRELSIEEGKELLKNGEYGILSTSDSCNQPYGIPLSYAYCNDVVYIHCTNQGGHKLKNIEENSKISFTVVDKVERLPNQFSTKYMSVIVFGKISIVDDEEKNKGIQSILFKYSPDYVESGMKYIEKNIEKIHILKIIIDKISTKGRKK